MVRDVLLCSHMKRTTVMLPVELQARAEQRARQEGISLGELVRRSLADRIKAGGASSTDPLFDDDTVFRGAAPTDLAAAHDRHLYDEER
jgi:hypothetical protein